MIGFLRDKWRSDRRAQAPARPPEIVEREQREQEDEAREYRENVVSTASAARAFSAGARWGSGGFGSGGSRLSGKPSFAERVRDAVRVGVDLAAERARTFMGQ